MVTLLDDEGVSASMQPRWHDRLNFGMSLATHQAIGECDWTFYAHPSLARVQHYVPRAFRKPYAIFAHGVEAWRELSVEERDVYRGAAVCVTNSEYTARRVAEANPDLPRLVPCHLALVPGEAPAAPARAAGGPPTVLMVGRMVADERYKGHDQLIDVWPAVANRVPNARLVLVGDGDDASRLRARAARPGGGDVVFEGFVTDQRLHALYEQADVFAMPSRGEGFGLVYLEAMAHRLPCIGSVHDAAREVIVDGVTGFLVDQADPGPLEDRLVGLLTDEAQRAALGHAGHRRLQSHFGFERFAERLTAALDPVIGPAESRSVEDVRSA